MSSFIDPAPAETQLGAFNIPRPSQTVEYKGRSGSDSMSTDTPLIPAHDIDASTLTMILHLFINFIQYLGLELLSIVGMVIFQLLLTYLINKYHGEFSDAIKRHVPVVLMPFVLPAAFLVSRICCVRHPSALRVIDVIEDEIQMRDLPAHRPLVDLA